MGESKRHAPFPPTPSPGLSPSPSPASSPLYLDLGKSAAKESRHLKNPEYDELVSTSTPLLEGFQLLGSVYGNQERQLDVITANPLLFLTVTGRASEEAETVAAGTGGEHSRGSWAHAPGHSLGAEFPTFPELQFSCKTQKNNNSIYGGKRKEIKWSHSRQAAKLLQSSGLRPEEPILFLLYLARELKLLNFPDLYKCYR